MKNKIFGIILFCVLCFILVAAKWPDNITNPIQDSCPSKQLNGVRKNLNISIFLDLSDRISPTFHPNPSLEYWKRDIGYINSITEAFIIHCKNKKVITLNDRIKLFFNPQPQVADINNMVADLNVEINRSNATMDLICSVNKKYQNAVTKIYNQTLKEKEPDAKKNIDSYPGSDIYDFFRSRAKDYCVKDGYRNILFVITDGYMYMRGNNHKTGNTSNYLLSKELNSWGFTQTNYNNKINNERFGFIIPTKGLDNLEVMVIGINPEKNWELDVINSYWSNWLKGMGVANFKTGEPEKYLKQADLPADLNEVIQNFIYN
jgi:hypothetical protein